MRHATKFNKPTVAEYLSAQIALCEKSQRDIATEIGYENPNVVSMLKTGQTKVPMNKVGPLAKALGLDPVFVLRLTMQEYLPETWEAIESAVKGTLLTANELELIRMYREISDNTDALPVIEDRDGTPVIALYAHMATKTTRALL